MKTKAPKLPESKYLVIGGNPFIAHQQGLRILGNADNEEEIDDIIEEHYYECAGLMMVLDLSTRRKVDTSELKLKHHLY